MGLHYTNIVIMTFAVIGTSLLIKCLDEYIVFYDKDWLRVPLINDTDMNTFKTQVLRYGFLPCSCEDSTCGCCVNMRLFSYNRTGCMNFKFDPKEFSIGMNMLMDGETIYENSVSAKNPPPACAELPNMYLPPLQFCIKLYDIYLPEGRLHMCVDLETKLARAPLIVLQFDCFFMGIDGISNAKPNVTSPDSTLVVNKNRTYLINNYNDTEISPSTDDNDSEVITTTIADE